MNRAEHPFDRRVKKKMNKAIKAAQRLPSTDETPLAKEVKSAKVREPKIVLDVAPQKIGPKKSKRTTPGEVIGHDQSAPESVNREGKRWITTLEKQVQSRSKLLSKRLLKKGRS
jgi:hypothetical protein